MHYPFRTYPAVPHTSTPAQLQRVRPLVPIRVQLPGGRSEMRFLLVDSGADYILFPLAVMSRLGITRTIRRPIRGVGGGGNAFFAPVELELLPNTPRTVRWNATVGFAALPFGFGLFGLAGGLEFFQTVLDSMHGRFSLYPHVVTPIATVPPYTPLPVP